MARKRSLKSIFGVMRGSGADAAAYAGLARPENTESILPLSPSVYRRPGCRESVRRQENGLPEKWISGRGHGALVQKSPHYAEWRNPQVITAIVLNVDETAIAEAIHSHAERNRELRAQLLSKGVSLGEPRPVEFHLWAFTHRDASVLARSLFEMGFLLRLLSPAPT